MIGSNPYTRAIQVVQSHVTHVMDSFWNAGSRNRFETCDGKEERRGLSHTAPNKVTILARESKLTAVKRILLYNMRFPDDLSFGNETD